MIDITLSDNKEKEDILLDINNDITNKRKENNIDVNDKELLQLQGNLLMMGFDLNMINKVIMHFNIRTINDALDYLSKSDDGMWHHPFVQIEEEKAKESDAALNNSLLDNVITRVKTLNFDVLSRDICEICGESKEFHAIIKNDANNRIGDNLLDYDLENNILLDKNDNNNIVNKELDNNNVNNDIDNNDCMICMDKIENPVVMEKCKHAFCHDCFQEYLNNLINQNNIDNIPCPNKTCYNKSLSENYFSQYLSEAQLIKYNQFKTKNEIAKDKLKIFCPLCNSYAKITDPEKYNTNNPSYKKSKLFCQKGHEFCSCGRPSHEGECYHDTEEFKNLIIQEKIKKCPKCGFLIKKTHGCNHMTCGNKACKYEFCWLCLQESLPDHFETGPCSGKQFIDPDSIFYQLEQKFPCLFYVFLFFKIIFVLLIIVITIGFPAFSLCFFYGFTLYENYHMEEDDPDKMYVLSKRLTIMHFIIGAPILLAVQTTFYFSIAIALAIFVLYLLGALLSLICPCICN
jgi:hypothetical protein